jgi:hypothetical protein
VAILALSALILPLMATKRKAKPAPKRKPKPAKPAAPAGAPPDTEHFNTGGAARDPEKFNAKRCTFTDPDTSKRCRAWRQKNKPGAAFCFVHDPEERARAHAAQSLGAHRRNAAAYLDASELPPKLETTDDVIRLLGITIRKTATGQLANSVASTIGFLATAALTAMKQGGGGADIPDKPRGLIVRAPIPDNRKKRKPMSTTEVAN